MSVSGSALNRGSVFGVIDGSSVLIESIPVSSGTHSIAADSKHNLIFVPMTYASPPTALPLGDQNFTGAVNASQTVSELTCGGPNGCIAVYKSGRTADNDEPYQSTPTIQLLNITTGSSTSLAVGDAYVFTISGAPPFSLVHVSEQGFSADLGYTDAAGSFRLSGTTASSVVGVWQQTWTIGGVAAQPSPLQFTISAKP